MKKYIFIIALSIFCLPNLQAQRNRATADTTKKTVVITSAFKPSLKPASKINFSASTPPVDTSRPSLFYNVPSQNLFFTYQPVSLKPLALSIDTSIEWDNSNYIKAGFGNYSTPFLQAGFSFRNGNNSIINVHTRHISQKGNLPFQQYAHSNAEIIGIFNTPGKSTEWRGRVGFDNNTQYLYGFQPDSLVFSKDQLRQRFTTFGGMVGLRNKEANDFGITYDPTLDIRFFGDNRSGKETNLTLNAPMSKTFGTAFAFDLGLMASLTSFKPAVGGTIKNNLYYLTPTVVLKTPNLKLNLGFIPSWDNQLFNLMPNFSATAKLNNEKFLVQAGWIGYFQKNTYQSLATINPFIMQPTALLNTRFREQYIGLKGSAGSHLTYNARVSIMTYSNAVLQVNDTIDGKSFNPVFEPDMKGLRLHGEIGYTVQEKFSLLAGATINQFSGLQINEKAWGLLPLEVTGSLRWQIFKDVKLKSDIFFWDGAQYRNKFSQSRKLKPAIDLSAGVEFAIMPKLNLWVDFNNVLNNRYQRWSQKEVLGFNVLGGVVYSFSQKSR